MNESRITKLILAIEDSKANNTDKCIMASTAINHLSILKEQIKFVETENKIFNSVNEIMITDIELIINNYITTLRKYVNSLVKNG